MASNNLLTKVGAGSAGFDYTKLDNNGNELSANATEWSCVRDNHSKLIWEIKTTDGGLRDTSNTYTWYDPDITRNGGHSGFPDGGTCTGSACDTHAFVQAFNIQGLCGSNDWRLPSLQELDSLIHYGRNLPTIDTTYFPDTGTPGWFWTSSPIGDGSVGGARYIDFELGYYRRSHQYLPLQVRLVRSGI